MPLPINVFEAQHQVEEDCVIDLNEADYTRGSRSAWLSMLQTCLRELGSDDPEVGKVRWIIEREQTVEALRLVCASHGDTNWTEDLNLADVVSKHLEIHLDSP